MTIRKKAPTIPLLNKNIRYFITSTMILYESFKKEKTIINWRIIPNIFKKANLDILENGLNVIVIKSDDFHNVKYSLLFDYKEDTKEIFIFKLATKYVITRSKGGDKIQTYQLLENTTIYDLKNERHIKQVQKIQKARESLKEANNLGLRIIKKRVD